MPDRPIIAIADDDPIAREVLSSALEGRCEVRLFDSGRTMLDGLAAHRADLLLLDVGMPDLDGYETCRALREGAACPDIPVIFLSARALLEDRLQGYAAGGNDYLVKPYDVDELHAKIVLAIDAACRARQLQGEVSDLTDAALLTAEMMGEVGVVLEFQRALASCTTIECVSDAMFAALARFGLEGCLRLKSRRTAIARSVAGQASSLESSLLEHLASRPDARIVTMGLNLGFSYGSVTLLTRSPAWAHSPQTQETADAMGRARDNVALLVEGAVVRLQAIDAEHDARQLAGAEDLIGATRTALQQVEHTEREIHAELDAVFEDIRHEFEMRFPQLGLTSAQEDSLIEIVDRKRSQGMAVLARGRSAEELLRSLVQQLAHSPRAAEPAAN